MQTIPVLQALFDQGGGTYEILYYKTSKVHWRIRSRVYRHFQERELSMQSFCHSNGRSLFFCAEGKEG